MPPPNTLDQLTDLFRKLSVQAPETWARSQADEGIPQLHRFLFLQQAWKGVLSDRDIEWMNTERRQAAEEPNAPFAGIGQALERLLAAGAHPADLTELARGMQARALSHFCYLLDDPSVSEPALDDLGWSLVATDANFAPTAKVIGGLHESMLEMDPTGRAMRPAKAP